MECNKAKHRETESRSVIIRVSRGKGGEVGELLAKGYQLPVIRLPSSGDTMYSMVVITNGCIIFLNVARRVNLICSQCTHMHTHTHTYTHTVIMCSHVLADLIVIIILQCISNHHTVYLKFTPYIKKSCCNF